MQCSVPFVQQSLCLQRGTTVYNGGSTNGCTVRFVYRIFEYSFVFGIFDSLQFRIFVLALTACPGSTDENHSGLAVLFPYMDVIVLTLKYWNLIYLMCRLQASCTC